MGKLTPEENKVFQETANTEGTIKRLDLTYKHPYAV